MSVNVEPTKQEQLLDYLRVYTDSRGYPPSTREMTAALGFRSVESIHRLLRVLKEDGKVTWEPRKARTLRIVE